MREDTDIPRPHLWTGISVKSYLMIGSRYGDDLDEAMPGRNHHDCRATGHPLSACAITRPIGGVGDGLVT